MEKLRLKVIIVILMVFLALPLVNAAHYITGIVNNARDGTGADGRIVVLWNPVNGMNDNLTDIIGPNGNSGANNIYMIDCEMLDNGCDVEVSQMGRCGPSTVLCLGFYCHGAATEHHLDELGKMMHDLDHQRCMHRAMELASSEMVVASVMSKPAALR